MKVMQPCCESVNGSCIKSSWSNSIRISMYIFMVCIILSTVFGNLMVIISISHFKQLHTPTNFLILSMATADFLLGFLIMPCSMVRSVEHCWYFGDFFCKIHTSMDIMLSTASIFHLSFISIDRYYAVCDPLRYKSKINTFVILVMIFISWTVPAGFAFGMIFLELNLLGAEEIYNHIHCAGGCFVFFSETSGVVASIVSFYIPGFVMLYVYRKIYSIAKRHARSIEAISQKKRYEMKKAAKTLSVVMLGFLICWFPCFFAILIDPFLNFSTPVPLFDALSWLGYLNSLCNPLIYGFFYPWFRKAFKYIVTGKIFNSHFRTAKLCVDTQ
uniref:Trace amine-associated receptor 1 n=1 Tax=Anser brachyrhynchus TaxID=132585 RepID=A0A8B9BWQ5_9AVES